MSPFFNRFDKLQAEVETNRILIAQTYVRELYRTRSLLRLTDAEFRVFSQWGEDGIIQYLISKVPIINPVFVEFGVGDYSESNTRFLLTHDNWQGLVIECDSSNVNKIRSSDLYWRHDLTAINEFLTRDNINSLIGEAGIAGDIGLLSIDVDGNDYWLWKAITADIISPRIVIVEYNSLFGNHNAVTIPYSDQFSRSQAHYSNLYYGASIKALCLLAKQKGYVFVGSNSVGNNAFFVRNDVSANIVEIDVKNGYVESKMRESRDEHGRLTYLSGAKRLKTIENENVIDVVKNRTVRIKDLKR
jgi:hypothetical protein